MKKSPPIKKPAGYPLTLSPELLQDYAMSLEVLNRSPKTLSWYAEILKRYSAFLDANPMQKPLGELGTQELKAYTLHLQKASRWANNLNIKKCTGKLSAHSIQGHVRAIKAFWSWLHREGYIAQNRLAGFPLPRAPEKPSTILSPEQITRLLASIDRLSPGGAKYYAVLLLLLDTGLRISELVHIRLEDLDLPHGCVTVLGKGQKVRTVPFSHLTRRQLTRYLNQFRHQVCAVESPYLFPKADATSLSVNSVQQFLRRLAKRAGLNGTRCSPHVFRHSFATHSVANGANVFVLKEIMGHSSLTTTMKYTHLQPHDLQVQHARFSPVAHLGFMRNRNKRGLG
jgi:site-specific recombinase XerD